MSALYVAFTLICALIVLYLLLTLINPELFS